MTEKSNTCSPVCRAGCVHGRAREWVGWRPDLDGVPWSRRIKVEWCSPECRRKYVHGAGRYGCPFGPYETAGDRERIEAALEAAEDPPEAGPPLAEAWEWQDVGDCPGDYWQDDDDDDDDPDF